MNDNMKPTKNIIRFDVGLQITIEAERLEEPTLLDDEGNCEGKWLYGGELTVAIDGDDSGQELSVVPLRDLIPLLQTEFPWGESAAEHIAHMRGMADCFENLAEELRHKAFEYEGRIAGKGA